MYAIVEILGYQYKVENKQSLFVNRIDQEVGSNIKFDKVLLIDNNNKISLGNPTLSGASVTAKVIKHFKGDKVIVFKKKRRKGYKVKNGHRQYLTEISINKISTSDSSKTKNEILNKAGIDDKATATKKTTAAKKTTATKKNNCC
jgi:large subunit ribosomal protein L21